MGTIKGLVTCEPAGSYDVQDLLVEIDSKRVKAECEIDDHGRFVFTDVPIGLPVKVVAGATGKSQGQSRGVDLRPSRMADVGDIVLTTRRHYYPSLMNMVRQDLENAYLEVDDPTFAACVDEDPNQVALLQPEGCLTQGATYTLYQARRPSTMVLIDKRGIVRAYPSAKDLDDWVQRLLAE